MSGSKRKSCGDVAATSVLFKVLCYKIKNAQVLCFLVFLCVTGVVSSPIHEK